MEGTLAPGTENSASGKLLNGRAAIDIDGITGSTIKGRQWVMPKRLFQIRTAKTFAPLAQDLRVARFFGETAA